MRFVPIECVKEGCYLGKTIFDNNGRILLREGVKLTNILINKIKQLDIYSLYINDEYSEKEIEDIIKPELRQKAVSTIKQTFYSLDKYNIYSSTSMPSSKKNQLLKQKQNYFENIDKLCEEIVEEILSKKNVLIDLVDIKSMDNYTYQHCVNVAIISLVLGIQLQLNKYELYNLCMGAIIHDIGKMLIPKEIIQKNAKLTIKEFEIVKQHTTKGYDYLLGNLDICAPSRIIVLQHHERENGTGYPDHRKSNEINRLAKIVAIADVYDALTSDRPYRKAVSPNEAIEYIMAYGQTLFDFEMVKAFSKAVVPYPPGTLVKLSTGDIGVVQVSYPNYPIRPTVKIIKKFNLNTCNDLIDLRTELDIVILGIVYEIPQ